MKMNEIPEFSPSSKRVPGNKISFASAEPSSRDARNIRVSLKQWRMFHAVIDFGGFFAGADSLHVTQSTVSHAVAKIQEQLGLPLFELKGRKAELTEAGKILLERSRELVRSAAELEELAANLRHGWGHEIRIVVDSSFPSHLLTLALQALSIDSRKIKLGVREASQEQAEQALRGDLADLTISRQVPLGFVGQELGQIEHVAVAHPKNPLFALKRQITADDLKAESQIVISDTDDYTSLEEKSDFLKCSRLWNVSSAERAVSAMARGRGYAWLPKHQLEQWKDGKSVRILPLPNRMPYKTAMHLVIRRSEAVNSVVRRYANALHACSERYFECVPKE
jgi:DNA-binding transcriptional LysR family regulator